jgi:hypothetical protein
MRPFGTLLPLWVGHQLPLEADPECVRYAPLSGPSSSFAASSLETVHFGPEYCVTSPFRWGGAANGRGREMNARTTVLQAAENNLKQLMTEVTRAMEKAQEAIAKIAPKTETAIAATESTTSSR